MSRHPPKFYALEALEDGRLSAAGKRRIEAHLLGCEPCSRARQSVRSYHEMVAAARGEGAPELSWQAFEAKLEREERKSPRRGKLIALTLPVLAIAATFAIAWIGLSGQRREAELAGRRVAPKVEEAKQPGLPTPALLEGAVTVVAGAASVGSVPAALGTRVREGDVLRTAEHEALHVRLSAATGISLWEDSEVRVVRLREAEVSLELVRGTVSNQVAKFGSNASYDVRAGDITASVRGTRFAVSRASDATSVAVHEGIVAVAQAGVERALLRAGQSWSSASAPALQERGVLAIAAESLTWPSLRLPQLPNVKSWTVDDTRFSGLSQVAMRTPPGELTLRFDDSQGVAHTLTRTIGPDGATLTEEEITRVIERDRESRIGTLDPQLITPVVRSGLDGLKRCYEQSLRRAPQLAGKLTLSLRVSSTGQVVRTKLSTQDGEPLDVGLTGCITGKAATWTFPAPTGGPVSIDLPLNLKSNSP